MSSSQTTPVRQMPDTLLILLALAALMAVVTWMVPAGHFERIERGADGRTASIELESFRSAERADGIALFSGDGSTGFLNFFFNGLVSGDRYGAAVGIIAFLLIVGGSFGMLMRTGAIDRSIHALIERTQGRPGLLIPVLFLMFSLGGAVFGMGEEAIPFCLLLAPLMVRLGYDAITAILVTYIATQIGFASSWMNPFSVAIAQGIAGLPLLSGQEFRIVMWVSFTIVGCAFTMWHAARVRAHPERSPSHASDAWFRDQAEHNSSVEKRFDHADALILSVLAATIAWIIWGVTQKEYYIPEIATQFLAMGLLCGLIGNRLGANRVSLNELAEGFRDGAAVLLPAALVIGMAKGLVLILGGSDPSQPSVLNTLLYYTAGLVDELPTHLSAWFMLLFQSGFNFFISSGSGQAALTMPIVAPLGDLVGVNRQISVLAFQLGDGLTNLIVPTSASLMATLGVARVDWLVWARFIALPLLVLMAMASLFVVGAVELDLR